jgi:hypothetical protein
MAGPVLRVFQTTTHAFNTLTEPKAQRACRKGETRGFIQCSSLKASHSRALGHIQLDRYTREQVSRLAASTLSRCLSTGSEIETQAEMDRKLHAHAHANEFRQNVSLDCTL